MRRPSGRIHHTSGRRSPLPSKNFVRRKTGCARRSAISCRENAYRSWSHCSQLNHEISLSWHHALLLPPWVRPHSSPPRSIGTPCESSSVVRKFRCWRARSALIDGSSVGPSNSQFHERLSSVPSLLLSPFASLCFSLYETRSRSVKPSCAVMKLIDANGLRPSVSYRSEEPPKREAKSRSGASPRQKSRIVSR